MKNAIKNMFYLGVGAASITRKKVEKAVGIFLKKGTIDKKEAREIVTYITSKADKVRRKLQNEGRREVKKFNQKIGSKRREFKRSIINKVRRFTN
jgi:polyhydroxyalkanoate synthesis regulator phasin